MSAIDAKAMYPAQKECQNADKNCLILAEDMSFIIKHKNDFGIQDIFFTRLIDLYSPYEAEEIQTDFETLVLEPFDTVYKLGYTPHKKTYRWSIRIVMKPEFVKPSPNAKANETDNLRSGREFIFE